MAHSNGAIAVRVHTPQGEKVVISCSLDQTFGQLKEKVWAKKNFCGEEKLDHFVLRLADGELIFENHDLISRLVKVAPVFRESLGRQPVLEVVLLPESAMGDKEYRKTNKPARNGRVHVSGYLHKRGKPSAVGSGWKRRFFLFQDLTLYYFKDEKEAHSGAAALGHVPMGSCHAVLLPEVKYKDVPCFELKAESVGRRDFVLCAEDSEATNKWVKAIAAFNLRRVKSIVVTICEELSSRGLNSQGLFRISGAKEMVAKLKADFDTATYPEVSEVGDEHALAGVLKATLREMQTPLLTHELYAPLLAAARLDPIGAQGLGSPKRLEAVKELLGRLPPANLTLLHYLLGFLGRVAARAEENLMTAQNLAIVFAPNILRPQVETVQASMTDNPFVLSAVAHLITHADTLMASVLGAQDQQSPVPLHISVTAGDSATAASSYSPSPSSLGKSRLSAALSPPPFPSSYGSGSGSRSGSASSLSGSPAMYGRSLKLSVSTSRSPSESSSPGTGLAASKPNALAAATALAELTVARRQYEAAWSTWESQIAERRAAVLAGWDRLQKQIEAASEAPVPLWSRTASGAEDADSRSVLSEAVARAQSAVIGDEEEWMEAALQGVARSSQALTSAADSLDRALTAHPPPPLPASAVLGAAAVEAMRPPPFADPQVEGPARDTEPDPAVPKPAEPEPEPVAPPQKPRGPVGGVAMPGALSQQMLAQAMLRRTKPSARTSAATPAPRAEAAKPVTRPAEASEAGTEQEPDSPAPPPPAPDDDDDLPPPPTPGPEPVPEPGPREKKEKSLGVCVALYAYPGGSRDNDISFEAGDRIEVRSNSDEQGWWSGQHLASRATGFFPGSYVKME